VEDIILADLSALIEFPAPQQYRNRHICSELTVSEPPEIASAHSVFQKFELSPDDQELEVSITLNSISHQMCASLPELG